MKNVTLLFSLLALTSTAFSQTIWDGPDFTFIKAANADWTLEENQDRITDDIWITRADAAGIFNIFSENGYSSFSSPSGTEWAYGTTADIDNLTFTSWEQMSGSQPPSMLGDPIVLHLVQDDIYIDLVFNSWGSGNGGGGGGGGGGAFSYTRSTAPSVGVEEAAAAVAQRLVPNPMQDEFRIAGIEEGTHVVVTDMLGALVFDGRVSAESRISTADWKPGVYFVRVNGRTLRAIKE